MMLKLKNIKMLVILALLRLFDSVPADIRDDTILLASEQLETKKRKHSTVAERKMNVTYDTRQDS